VVGVRKEKAMRAGTVAWSRIIGVCFQFNDFVVVKRSHNEIQKITQATGGRRGDHAHNRRNLIPDVATASTMT
jgi:hypothetical protein